MAKQTYRVFRINPEKRYIGTLRLASDRSDFTKTIQNLCRARHLGHRFICEVEGMPLYIACDAQAAEGQPGFRFRGSKDVTAGIAILFGRGPGGGLVSAPVDLDWIERHITWTTPEETDADEEK